MARKAAKAGVAIATSPIQLGRKIPSFIGKIASPWVVGCAKEAWRTPLPAEKGG